MTQGFGLSSKRTPPEAELQVSMDLWSIASSGSAILQCHLADAFLQSDMLVYE